MLTKKIVAAALAVLLSGAVPTTLVLADADTTAPVIVPTVTPAPNASGWNNTDVTVTWSVTDPESAITSPACDPVTLTDETAGTVVTCSATSGGGTSSQSVTVKIDKTKPVIIGSASPVPNGAGWNNSPVTISFSCADDGAVQSGIAVNTVTGGVIQNDGIGRSMGSSGDCIDAAGNSADQGTVSGINIDQIPPLVTIITPVDGAVYAAQQAVVANWSATDAFSGIASVVGTVASGDQIDTSSPGQKTFTVTAIDTAGNVTTKTLHYTVINDNSFVFNAPLANKQEYKINSTIPVKFQLTNSSTGAPITDATATLTVNGVPAVSSGSSNSGNTFRFEPSGMQYVFNLATAPLSLGTNTLEVHLSDGSVHTQKITLL